VAEWGDLVVAGEDEPKGSSGLSYGLSPALIAWCAIALLVFAVGITVIQ
jgi:hypothetical protein